MGSVGLMQQSAGSVDVGHAWRTITAAAQRRNRKRATVSTLAKVQTVAEVTLVSTIK